MKIIVKSFSVQNQKKAKESLICILDCFLFSNSNTESEMSDLLRKGLVHFILKEFHFGSRKKRYTVIRSPHVYKKSREQFESRMYKSIYQIPDSFFPSKEEYEFFLYLLKTEIFSGSQLKIESSSYSYFCAQECTAQTL